MSVSTTGLPEPDLGRMRRERLSRLREEMAHQEIDAALLLQSPNVAYATGFVSDAVDVSHATHRRTVAIVASNDQPPRLHAHGDSSQLDRFPDGGLSIDIGTPLWPELASDMEAMSEAIGAVIGDPVGKRIAVDGMTGAMARAGVLSGAELVDAGRLLGAVRLRKTDDELACIERAQRINERAMFAIQPNCRPGARRSEVAGAFLRELRSLGGHHNEIDPIFQPMPCHRNDGPRTSTGHVAFPIGIDDPEFAEGDLVWVDSGHTYEGYTSDFGRTWIVGRDPSTAEHELFARWTEIMAASYAAIRPGATLGDVGRAAIAANNGAVPWLPHFYLAHAVGLSSAEMPIIGCDLGQEFDDCFVLEAGMVIVLEPVVWEDGVGGYRAEEIVAVTDDGWRLLGGNPGYAPFGSGFAS